MFYRQIFRYILISLFFIPPILEGEVRFTDVTYSAGIEFFHIDGRSGNKYFMETLGAGVAFFDYEAQHQEEETPGMFVAFDYF